MSNSVTGQIAFCSFRSWGRGKVSLMIDVTHCATSLLSANNVFRTKLLVISDRLWQWTAQAKVLRCASPPPNHNWILLTPPCFIIWIMGTEFPLPWPTDCVEHYLPPVLGFSRYLFKQTVGLLGRGIYPSPGQCGETPASMCQTWLSGQANCSQPSNTIFSRHTTSLYTAVKSCILVVPVTETFRF
jgi:hypothetical protein